MGDAKEVYLDRAAHIGPDAAMISKHTPTPHVKYPEGKRLLAEKGS